MTRVADWRWLVCVTICAYFGALTVLSSSLGEEKAWHAFGVPHVTPRFADMHGALTWLEVKQEGRDPFQENHFDAYGRKMNYPRIWLALGSLGITSQQTVILGSLVAATFFVALFWLMGRVTPPEAVLYSALVCTPAVMLGVERGNLDLFLFGLCVLAGRWLCGGVAMRWCAYGLILLCGMLKLFPIAGLSAVLRERRRVLFTIATGAGAIFAAYLAMIHADLAQMWTNTPQQWFISYGRPVFAMKLVEQGIAVNVTPLSVLLLVSVTLLAAVATWRTAPPQFSPAVEASYLIGAGIYAGTFAVGSSFNYRLVFLLLTVPQLLAWMRNKQSYYWLGFSQLLGVVIALSVSPFHERCLFALREVACWYLFGTTLFVLMHRLAIALKSGGEGAITR